MEWEKAPAESFGSTASKKARAARKLGPIRNIGDDLHPYLAVFWFLHRGRQYSGFGFPCGLPLSEIRGYLDEYEIDGEERRRHIRFLHALDSEFLKVSAEKAKTPAKKGASNGGTQGSDRRKSSSPGQ